LQYICFFIAFPVKCMSIFWKEMIAGSDLSEQYAGKLKDSYSTSSVRICRTKEMNISFNSLFSHCFSLNTVLAVKFDIANT
jgi:hypothetical protein